MSLSKKWNIWAEGWLSCQLLYLPHYTTLLYQPKSHSDTDLHLATFMFCVYAGVGWYNAPTLLQLTPHHMWSGHPTFTLQRHNLETLWQNTYFKIIIIRRTIALPASADPSFMQVVTLSMNLCVAVCLHLQLVPRPGSQCPPRLSCQSRLARNTSPAPARFSGTTQKFQSHNPHNTHYYQGEIVIVESC